PGLDEKDISVTLEDGMLSIKGEKKTEKEEKKKNYTMSERSYGSFHRAFRLPEAVEEGKIDAAFDKGVLKITMPKKPGKASKAKMIAIKNKG
ncbi:MAG: Hsp20/alpha crystallin family protein, partial [Alphaproteobacteria bacterium]